MIPANLRSQVDSLWDKFWSGGLSNPLDAIEQFTFLLFLKRMDDAENTREKQARRRGEAFEARIPAEMRWQHWTNLKAEEALKTLNERIFPWMRGLGERGSSFEQHMQNADCKIKKASLLIEGCKIIDQMEISQQSQDIQGDLYEYLLSKLNTAGRNGQFRTPRHIIRMMVRMIAPKPDEQIADMAAGTAGFLVNAFQYILESHTSPEILEPDEDGWPQHLIGDQLEPEAAARLKRGETLHGFDNDSGMTMLRIGAMNLILHGIEAPHFDYMDTLSKDFTAERKYDVVLMNPPFKGAVDKGTASDSLPSNTGKTELLFVHLILRALEMGGRCAVIVPDGVLFGSSRAHLDLRKRLVEENRLDGVVSMPGGVFRPYAGVSTAVLLFTRGGTTERVWFYDMEHDGFSLDDKRTKTEANDIPDLLTCWEKRFSAEFETARSARLAELRTAAEPLKTERLSLLGEINRLRFDNAIAPESDGSENGDLATAKATLEALESRLTPLQAEIDQLTRQFWVTKADIKGNKYDLSASRYRIIDEQGDFYEKPSVTLDRMLRIEEVMVREIDEISKISGQ